MSLPLLKAKYIGDPSHDFPEFSKNDFDSLPMDLLSIFWVVFSLQTITFLWIFYALWIGYLDETCFRSKSWIPFFSGLYEEPEQEYSLREDDDTTHGGGNGASRND